MSAAVVKGVAPRRARKEPDLLVPNYNSRILCSPATEREVLETYPLAREQFGASIAPAQTVLDVLRINRLSVWVMRDARTGQGLGCHALLFLNAEGEMALRAGELDGVSPSPHHLARADERPSAIYHWLLVARGRAAAGVAMVTSFLNGPQFAEATYYGRAATDDGARFLRKLGFKLLAPKSQYFYYERLASRQRAKYAEELLRRGEIYPADLLRGGGYRSEVHHGV